jgi:hypothetical protein
MNADFENENRLEIEAAIEQMLPDKLANGLNKRQARAIYLAENKVILTNAGLFVKDRKLNDIKVEDHIKLFVEGFETKKTELESFTRLSEVEAYFDKENVPLSERSGILSKAMKNKEFKMNE